MAELDTRDRDRLRDSQFAYVDKQGEGHLPINNASHVRNAVARFNQTEFESGGSQQLGRWLERPIGIPDPDAMWSSWRGDGRSLSPDWCSCSTRWGSGASASGLPARLRHRARRAECVPVSRSSPSGRGSVGRPRGILAGLARGVARQVVGCDHGFTV